MNMKTSNEIEKTGIDKILLLMKEKCHYDLSIYNHDFIDKSLERRRIDLGIPTIPAYVDYLFENDNEAVTLYRSLSITYTQFFRDPVTFAFLEQTVLPSLLSHKQDGDEFRVWSAGCATGQEAYSLAILLSEMLATQGKKVRFRIFATDSNDAVLLEAKKGVYAIDTMQNVRLKQLSRYFQKSGDSYLVHPDLKKHISFSRYDLLDPASINPSESIYGDFDLVICCNLLIYYSQDTQRFIIDRLVKSVSPTGALVTGEAERGLVERWSPLPMISPQVPIFKRSSLDQSTLPLWRNSL